MAYHRSQSRKKTSSLGAKSSKHKEYSRPYRVWFFVIGAGFLVVVAAYCVWVGRSPTVIIELHPTVKPVKIPAQAVAKQSLKVYEKHVVQPSQRVDSTGRSVQRDHDNLCPRDAVTITATQGVRLLPPVESPHWDDTPETARSSNSIALDNTLSQLRTSDTQPETNNKTDAPQAMDKNNMAASSQNHTKEQQSTMSVLHRATGTNGALTSHEKSTMSSKTVLSKPLSVGKTLPERLVSVKPKKAKDILLPADKIGQILSIVRQKKINDHKKIIQNKS